MSAEELRKLKLKERIARANGSTPAEAGKLFGWEPSRVTKRPVDFDKDDLIARGWTRANLEDVALAYEDVDRATPGHGNPSAAARARQLREIIAEIFDLRDG